MRLVITFDNMKQMTDVLRAYDESEFVKEDDVKACDYEPCSERVIIYYVPDDKR